MSAPRTLFDKIWDSHLVERQDDGTCLIYIDRHLVHEVTSPQAFEGLRLAGRAVRRPDLTLAVADHNVPTTDRSQGIDDEESLLQVETLSRNCAEFDIPLFAMDDIRQGIVHIISPVGYTFIDPQTRRGRNGVSTGQRAAPNKKVQVTVTIDICRGQWTDGRRVAGKDVL